MIWFQLALFAVSFIATALLAPKPDIEDARPQQLDPESFPRATEDAPATLVIGCAIVRGPNTLWYGNFRSVPIREKVKTGLFSSKRITKGYEYYLTLNLGINLGASDLKEIIIDSVPVDPGLQTSINEDFTFYNCDLQGQRYFEPGGARDPTSEFDFGEICFEDRYDALGSQIDNEFILENIGVDLDVIDKGEVKFDASYVVGFFTNFSTSGPVALRVEYYTGTTVNPADEIFSPDGPGLQSVTNNQDDGAYFETALPQHRIPAGTRMFNIVAEWAPTLILFTATITGLHRVRLSGEAVFYTTQNFDIFEPELFGGKEEGGGWIGNVDYYPGTFDQPQSAVLQTATGLTDIPAYRGLHHLVFDDNYIGESPNIRKIEFKVGCYTDSLGLGTFGRAFIVDDTVSPIVYDVDASPAEAMHFILLDRWRGLSTPPAKVDTAGFTTIGNTLIAEQHGMSAVVSGTRQGKDVLSEILRQIDGVLVEDQQGRVTPKLIRDDYDPNALPIYGEGDIEDIRSYSRTSWRDLVTEVKVSFSNRDGESGKVAIAQDMATFNMVGNRRVANISFPFCYNPALAANLAQRELSRLSVPLIRFSAIMNRNALQFGIGDVVKVDWPELGIVELIVRVQKINLGKLDNNRIRVEFLQDVFAATTTVFAEPPPSLWEDLRPSPVDVVTTEIVETPYFLGSRMQFPIEDGQGHAIPFALRPAITSDSFTFNAGDAIDDISYFDPQAAAYPVTGLLESVYGEFAGWETGTDVTGFTVNNMEGTPVVPDTAQVKPGNEGLMYVGGEWMAYEGVIDPADGTFDITTIRRGIMGTRPLRHNIGTRVWFFNTDLLGDGAVAGELLEDGTLWYKYLDRVGNSQRSDQFVTEQSQALQDISDRPQRPGDLRIDGSRAVVPILAQQTPTFSLSWVPRDRTAELLAYETDPSETPDQAETYDVEVWIDGVQIGGLDQIGVTSPVAIDLTGQTGVGGELRVYSRRTVGDLKRSFYFSRYPFSLSLTVDSIDVTVDQTEVTGDQA